MNARVVIGAIMCLLVLFQLQLAAQKNKGNKEQQPPQQQLTAGSDDLLSTYKEIYAKAMSYGDYSVATNAVYQLLANGGSETYKDTLAFLYFNGGNYVQAILVSEDVLKQKPNDLAILEITAVSQQNLGLPKEALESYEKLYSLNPDIFHLYNIASLQYTLKRFGECSATLDAILRAEENTEEITITNNNGQSQKVPIKAAALNMLGVMALEMNETELAAKSFNDALKIAPQFALAKGNLQRLQTTAKEKPKE